MKRVLAVATGAIAMFAVGGGVLPGTAAPTQAQYRQAIANDLSACAPGGGPAVRLTVRGVKSSQGKVRVQIYRATEAEWLAKGKWLSRIELPAQKGTMTFCVPAPKAGSYAVAVRHDVNGNGKTDLRQDGGAMSNNPSINVFNLGKPSVSKTRFDIGANAQSMSVNMLYL